MRELAAAAGEDRRKAGETGSLFLVAFGGESSDPAAVRQHAGANSCSIPSRGLAEAVGNRAIDPALPGTEKCLRYRLQRAADTGSGKFI